MTQAKQSAKRERKTTEPPPEQAGDADEGVNLRGRVDQFGALLTKGLDLAEAGLGLGVTLVNRVGSVAQQQIVERFMTAATAATAAAATEQPPPPDMAAPEMAAAQAAAPAAEPEAFGISNRLPLMPGGEVRVSFSINNDSMEAPKKVVLALEGFIGEAHGQHLDSAGLSLKPAKKTIAPMDFEKFVLAGAVPANVPPDVYRGWVVVASDAELRIPVWLVVSSL